MPCTSGPDPSSLCRVLVVSATSLKDAGFDRRPSHESDVGAGFPDVLETRDNLPSMQDVPGLFGSVGRFDAQVRFAVAGMAVQKVAGCPIHDAENAGTQDGAAAVLARFDQERNFQGSGRAVDPTNDIMLLEPGFAGVSVARNQAYLALLGAAGFQNLGGILIGAGIEVGRARQGRLAPGVDGITVLFVAGEGRIVLVGECQVRPAQLLGDLIGVVAGVGKAKAGIAFAAIDHVKLLLGIDADFVHVRFLSKRCGTRGAPQGSWIVL